MIVEPDTPPSSKLVPISTDPARIVTLSVVQAATPVALTWSGGCVHR